MLERPEPDAFALLMPLLAVAVSAYDVCLHVCMLYGACSYLLRYCSGGSTPDTTLLALVVLHVARRWARSGSRRSSRVGASMMSSPQ